MTVFRFLENVGFWLFGDFARWFSRIDQNLDLLEDLIMVSKSDVLAAIEELKVASASEKTEVLAALNAAVTAAVAPLEQIIATLTAQLEGGAQADLFEILEATKLVKADIEAIVEATPVEPEPNPVEPVDPVEPAPTEPAGPFQPN